MGFTRDERNEVLRDLVGIMDEANLTGLQFDDGDVKVKLERNPSALSPAALPLMADRVSALLAGKGESRAAVATAPAPEPEDAGVVVRSPTVGMFYTAPSPDEDPFVKVGQEVLSGQTLAIVEAMKMMNEVSSPVPGIVTEILAANGTQVEYDQPLFRISTAEAGQ